MKYCLWLVGDADITDSQLIHIQDRFVVGDIDWELTNHTAYHPCRSGYQFTSAQDIYSLKDHLRACLKDIPLDGIILPWEHRQLRPELIIMDMDSTLVQAETIDQIAKHAGVMDKVAEITEAAMRGELDFKDSLKKRVAMLEGLSESDLEPVHDALPLTEGAEQLIRAAKANGCLTVLVSGGFNYFARPLAAKLGIDEVYANDLGFEAGRLTGKVDGHIVDAEFKQQTLKRLIEERGLDPDHTIAIGDGANDLLMLSSAGLGIAFHGKPRVQDQAIAVINHYGLNALHWLIGWD